MRKGSKTSEETKRRMSEGRKLFLKNNPNYFDDQKKKLSTVNFIPYPKTGAIMMVIRRDTLDKIKELLKKIDVPKKMVHIEVMLFEKMINNQNNFGLNLLKIGTPASNTHETGVQYESQPGSFLKGVLQFIISRKKSRHSQSSEGRPGFSRAT